MDDLIYRAAAIEALGEKPLAWTESEYEQGLQNQWEQDVDALMALPAADVRPMVHDDDMKRAARAAQRALARIPAAQQWVPVTERLPGEFVSVQAHMTDAEPFPSVREAYLAGGEWFFPALNEYHPVDKWAEFLESSEEDET